jgi:hypothetical protein
MSITPLLAATASTPVAPRVASIDRERRASFASELVSQGKPDIFVGKWSSR